MFLSKLTCCYGGYDVVRWEYKRLGDVVLKLQLAIRCGTRIEINQLPHSLTGTGRITSVSFGDMATVSMIRTARLCLSRQVGGAC